MENEKVACFTVCRAGAVESVARAIVDQELGEGDSIIDDIKGLSSRIGTNIRCKCQQAIVAGWAGAQCADTISSKLSSSNHITGVKLREGDSKSISFRNGGGHDQ